MAITLLHRGKGKNFAEGVPPLRRRSWSIRGVQVMYYHKGVILGCFLREEKDVLVSRTLPFHGFWAHQSACTGCDDGRRSDTQIDEQERKREAERERLAAIQKENAQQREYRAMVQR